jgi:hypothetical protein
MTMPGEPAPTEDARFQRHELMTASSVAGNHARGGAQS